MMLLTAVVAGAAALFILSPLLGWGVAEAFEPDAGSRTRAQDLRRRREEALTAIKDLELEFEVGKLTREDYEQTREALSREAIEVYRQMDEHGRR